MCCISTLTGQGREIPYDSPLNIDLHISSQNFPTYLAWLTCQPISVFVLIGFSPNLNLLNCNFILPQELNVVTYYDYPSTNGFDDELDGYNYFACVNEDAAKW